MSAWHNIVKFMMKHIRFNLIHNNLINTEEMKPIEIQSVMMNFKPANLFKTLVFDKNTNEMNDTINL